MAISIRSPEVGQLARELAQLRGTNMTEAIAHALREETSRERERSAAPSGQPEIIGRLEALARKVAARAGANRRPMTKDEIDEMVGS